jgi:hypothetical protein
MVQRRRREAELRAELEFHLGGGVTLITHETLRRESRTLSGVIASSDAVGRPGEIDVSGERRHAFVQLVSDNYFTIQSALDRRWPS